MEFLAPFPKSLALEAVAMRLQQASEKVLSIINE